MKNEELLAEWYSEEKIAHIKGWDFSHIEGRYQSDDDLPWEYKSVIQSYLKPDMRVLDIDTGGGEFLLSLGHPNELLAATENYEPNVRLCKEKLLPLGIDFRQADGSKEGMSFETHSFDMILNRHGDFNPKEIRRLLKPGGLFITQQVGAENDRELVELLFEKAPELLFPNQYLKYAKAAFEEQGFQIVQAEEAYRPITFFDVGALVWFAHIIAWEFPDFSVDKCWKGLCRAQQLLEERGVIEGRIHRFLLVTKV